MTSSRSPLIAERPTPVLFVDLDGTVRHGPGELGRFVGGPADVVVFSEAVEMLRRWKSGGGRIIGVSNQGGIALGHLTMEMCARAMLRTNELCGGVFDKMCWCAHHPRAEHPEMARCWCRKPAPGLLIEGALRLAKRTGETYPPYMSLFVGDRPEDRECARVASVDFMDAREWRAQAASTEMTT